MINNCFNYKLLKVSLTQDDSIRCTRTLLQINQRTNVLFKNMFLNCY